MSKKTKVLWTLVSAVTGGGFFLGEKCFQLIVRKRPQEEAGTIRKNTPKGRRTDVRLLSIDQLRLHAIYLEPEEKEVPHRYCILLHDTKSRAEDLFPYATHYLALGRRVLIPDFKGHGESDGTFYGYGYDDRYDVLTLVHWILKRDPDAKIVLHGLGTGAAAALFALPEHMPGAVYAVISDSSYVTLTEYLSRILRYVYPSKLPLKLRLFALRLVTRIRAGYDIGKADVRAALECATTPVLFLHGDADTQLHADCAKRLYAAAHCTRQLSIILGAGHLKSIEVNGAHYWSQIDAFMKKHDPDRP